MTEGRKKIKAAGLMRALVFYLRKNFKKNILDGFKKALEGDGLYINFKL
ncbi:MAG: hypothetical protein ACE5DO_07590 [Desulfobacterales bacterium]